SPPWYRSPGARESVLCRAGTQASERRGQAVTLEDAVPFREAGDPDDAVAVDGEDHQAVRGAVGVRSQRRLTVRANGHQADAIEPAVQRDGPEEGADRGSALDSRGLGRHRQERVVSEQADDPLDVDSVPRLLKPPHQVRFDAIARGRV